MPGNNAMTIPHCRFIVQVLWTYLANCLVTMQWIHNTVTSLYSYCDVYIANCLVAMPRPLHAVATLYSYCGVYIANCLVAMPWPLRTISSPQCHHELTTLISRRYCREHCAPSLHHNVIMNLLLWLPCNNAMNTPHYPFTMVSSWTYHSLVIFLYSYRRLTTQTSC